MGIEVLFASDESDSLEKKSNTSNQIHKKQA